MTYWDYISGITPIILVSLITMWIMLGIIIGLDIGSIMLDKHYKYINDSLRAFRKDLAKKVVEMEKKRDELM